MKVLAVAGLKSQSSSKLAENIYCFEISFDVQCFILEIQSNDNPALPVS